MASVKITKIQILMEGEMAMRYCYREMLPFTVMVLMEGTMVGMNTLFKAAASRGMSNYVFMVYSYAISALVLLPSFLIISLRSGWLPALSFSVLRKVCLLGLIGYTTMIMGYTGINFSSPALASALSSLVPAFTFIVALIFRMEKLDLRSKSSQAKIAGTVVSIIGAFVVTLYKGPPILLVSSSSITFHQPLHSSPSNWVAGSLFLIAQYLQFPFWYILQVLIVKELHSELVAVFLYNVWMTVIAAMVGLVAEKNSSAWRIRQDVALASIVCSGLFVSCLGSVVHTWALHVKGPVYVAMFKPLSIAIAVAMGAMFLGDILHLGSAVGATIISIGFYIVLWGKAKEEMETSSSAQKIPLLQQRSNFEQM